VGLDAATAWRDGDEMSFDCQLFVGIFDKVAQRYLDKSNVGQAAELRSPGQPGAAVPTRVKVASHCTRTSPVILG